MDDRLLLVLLGAAALTARLGLGLYLSGMCRSKNAAAGAMLALCDLCVAVLAFWAVGDAVLSGDRGAVLGWGGSFGAASFFYATAVLVATGAAAGSTLERAKLFPPLFVTAVLAGVVVPLAGAWAWRGWLYRLGFVDVGGATVLHVCGGVCAAAGAVFVGPRSGKYNRDGSSNFIPGHQVPLAAAGVTALAAGYVAVVVGLAVSHGTLSHGAGVGAGLGADLGASAANAFLAAAAGGLAGALYGRFRFGKAEVYFTLSGLLAAVVAVSAGAGRLPSAGAVAVGAAAGIVVPMAVVYLDLRRRIDDVGSGIAVHAVGGAWGTLAAGLLPPGGAADRLRHVGVQAVGLAAVAGLALAASAGVYFLLSKTVGLRLSEADEYDGADLAEHDLNAYPDFQQTMIKSYHLREA